MKITADTNTFIAVALNEPEKHKIIQLSEGCDLAAPDVLPFEIGNALTAMTKKGILQIDEMQTSWDIIQFIPVELRRIDIKAALEIAATFNIYAYDAYFLECASSLKCPIMTLDPGMQRIAQEMGILVLE
jgi:predicted nucleic acid-binding protein